jgi:hypothetical protein
MWLRGGSDLYTSCMRIIVANITKSGVVDLYHMQMMVALR